MRRLRRYFANHARNFRDALARIFGQPTGSLLTLSVISIALALPAGLNVLVGNASALSAQWESVADFTVYLELGVDATRAREVAAEIEALEDVASVELITREAALAEFRQHSGFGGALDALNENPLPHTLVVRPAGGAAGAVEPLAETLRARPDTALVRIDTQWVERIRAMLVLAERAVRVVGVLLGLAVVLVIGNTIRLEINNRSDEIEVMKLVGGSDGFIRRPFLYVGLCYGLGGALGAAALNYVALALVAEPVRELATLYTSSFRLSGLGLTNTLRLLGAGAALGLVGAWIAAARHLKAIEPR